MFLPLIKQTHKHILARKYLTKIYLLNSVWNIITKHFWHYLEQEEEEEDEKVISVQNKEKWKIVKNLQLNMPKKKVDEKTRRSNK